MGRLKQKVYINLPPEIVEKARKHGLNISKVSENALIDMINRIEASDRKTEPVSSVNASSQEGLVGLRRFELQSREPKSRSLDQASRQPLFGNLESHLNEAITKTLWASSN